MKKIRINKKKGIQGLCAIIDNEDYDRVMKYNWSASKSKNTIYACTWVKIEGKVKTIMLHRFILNVTDNKVWVDHKDGNGLNCQRSNIRIATASQNAMNKGASGKSTYIGVSHYFDKRAKIGKHEWQSSIRVNGVKKSLGRFETEKEAAIAYDIAANFYHKEFAKLNFIKNKDCYDNIIPEIHNKEKHKSSQYRGVSQYKVSYVSKRTGETNYYDRWVSQIKVNGKSKYLGLFKTEVDAAVCYDEAAKKYFGELSNLNFR